MASLPATIADSRKPAKVAIVTGASSGIGKDTVLRFLEAGYVVHAAARRLEEMRDLERAGAVLHHLDLTQSASIAACAAAVLAQGGRVDVLVNNAGYGLYGAIEDVPLDAARAQMEVNLFGLADMTKAVLPAMRAQRSGRIVNITSVGGKLWSPLGGWYHASKFAVEGLSDCLRNELRPFGIDVIVVEPGAIKTEWPAIAVANVRQMSGAGAYRPLAESVGKLFADPRLMSLAVAPRVIADTILHAATVRKPKARYVAPLSGRFMLWLRWILSDRIFDRLTIALMRMPRQLATAAEA